MKRWFLLLVMFGCFFVGVQRALAFDVAIRALLPHPSTGSDEWISVENTAEASVSGQLYGLRDVVGSVKTFALSDGLAARSQRRFFSTQTKIALNDSGDQVSLLYLGQAQETTPLYSSAAVDQVWWRDSLNQWHWSPLSEYERREREQDWVWALESSPEPSASLSAEVSPVYVSHLELKAFSACTIPEWIEVAATLSGQLSEVIATDLQGEVARWEKTSLVADTPLQLSWSSLHLSNSGETFRVWLGDHEENVTYPACSSTLPWKKIDDVWQQAETAASTSQSTSLGSELATPVPTLEEPSPVTSNLGMESSSLSSDTSLQLSATTSGQLEVPGGWPPHPQRQEEIKRYLNWQNDLFLGGWLVGGGGLILLGLGAVPLWRCYNEYLSCLPVFDTS